jgi:dihydrofolate synthase/folylpolyglutamate synthase
MNYQETVEYLFSKLPMFQRIGAPAIKYNLDNITRLMEALGNPHKSTKTIHVAGTNGKGSSSHMIASVLQEAGFKTGLYTSPHLKSFTERIRVDGNEIEEEAVIKLVENYQELIEQIEPSFFEISFAMAMDYFRSCKVDYAVVEVGLGGRLDSTNIIDPEVCLITNISMDHQQFLGNDLPTIAGEKAGIIKPGVPVVISEHQTDEISDVFKNKAKKSKSIISFASTKYFTEQAADDRINVFKDNKLYLEGFKPDLMGEYQVANILGVIELFSQLDKNNSLKLSDSALRDGLENVVQNTGLKGRWQTLSKKPLTIADTGHNESAIREIIKMISRSKFDKLHMVWGMVNDKDVGDILDLLPKNAQYYFVKADVPRALSLDRLVKEAELVGLQGQTCSSVKTGYMAAKESAGSNDMIYIGGSTFVVAEIEDL